ncbi:MAG TPA: ribosome biogenesis GTP-binding protein YihA/YsxC [Candidatus Deferrimicrobiaceae bacterium]|nr:ribosome biogenesis GTP-binding protein YihA/YsxC [Candidatus Deferrimicrobiaceae bacterium]
MSAQPRFLIFDPTGEGWPKISLPQVAFAGRSNVGKSSLLNALVGHSRLARVSRTPGRTRGIAVFEIEGRFAFADLPGYGFAKVSKAERETWKRLVEGYFSGCRRLRKVYLLVDVRRGPEKEERMLADYLASLSIPYRWVGTKADKIPAKDRKGIEPLFSGASWLDAGGPPVIVSAKTKAGIDLLWRDIRKVFSS